MDATGRVGRSRALSVGVLGRAHAFAGAATPPVTLIAPKLRAGSRWRSDLRRRPDRLRPASSGFLRVGHYSPGGIAFPAYQIEARETATGALNGTTTTRGWFLPRLGLYGALDDRPAVRRPDHVAASCEPHVAFTKPRLRTLDRRYPPGVRKGRFHLPDAARAAPMDRLSVAYLHELEAERRFEREHAAPLRARRPAAARRAPRRARRLARRRHRGCGHAGRRGLTAVPALARRRQPPQRPARRVHRARLAQRRAEPTSPSARRSSSRRAIAACSRARS